MSRQCGTRRDRTTIVKGKAEIVVGNNCVGWQFEHKKTTRKSLSDKG